MKIYFVWRANVVTRDWYRNPFTDNSECDNDEYEDDVYIKFNEKNEKYKSPKYFIVVKWLVNNNMFHHLVDKFTQPYYNFYLSSNTCKLLEFKTIVFNKPTEVTEKIHSTKNNDINLRVILIYIYKTNSDVYVIFKKLLPKELINLILTNLIKK